MDEKDCLAIWMAGHNPVDPHRYQLPNRPSRLLKNSRRNCPEKGVAEIK